MKGNAVITTDPSVGLGGKTVPQNEPSLGKLDASAQHLPEQRSEDASELAMGGRPRPTDPDEVAHSHADLKHDAAVSSTTSSTSSDDIKVAPGLGALGNRNVESEDILGGSGYSGYSPSDIGDAINPEKGVQNTRSDTMRPMYGMANPKDAIPSLRQQLKSDLLFSDFSVVAPGHGLGVTNKMFLMEENREKKIVCQEPMAFPRSYQGPSGCTQAPPLEFQNEISKADRRSIQKQDEDALIRMALVFEKVGSAATNVLGSDVGFLKANSDKGLNRAPDIVFEPIIRRPHEMERDRMLTGQQLSERSLRRLWDPMRFPERFTVTTAMEGGPTMTKQKAFALLSFPIGTA